MSADSPTGSVVSGFRIGELLARGAMGAVYLARGQRRPTGRAEAAVSRARPRRAVPPALPARIAPRGDARPSQRGEDDRLGRGRRGPLPGHGVRERDRSARAPAARGASRAPPRSRAGATGRRGARRRTSCRPRPPRREAWEHPRRTHVGRCPCVRLRLRAGAARLVSRQPHRRPRLRRHGRLRRTRADPRAARWTDARTSTHSAVSSSSASPASVRTSATASSRSSSPT